MDTNTITPPKGFVIDQKPPEGFVLDTRARIPAEPVDPMELAIWNRERWLEEQIEAGNIEQVPPTFWERFREDIPQMAGGTVGGMVGAKGGAMAGAKIPVGHPILKGAAIVGGAVLGAGIGGMGGKGYQQYYRMTRPGARPMTFGEIYNEQMIAGIEEGASELIGRGVAKVGAKALAPVKKRLLPGAKSLGGKLFKRGAHITPAQATESRIIDTLEGMAEKSFLGGGKLQRLKRISQPGAFSEYIDDVVGEIARGAKKNLSPEEVGDLLLDTIYGKKTAFRAATKAAYSKVDKLSEGIMVNLGPLKQYAAKQMRQAATRKGIGATQAGDVLLNKVMKLSEAMDFRQTHALRSALMDERSAMALTKDKAIGLVKRFISLTDEAMESSAGSLKGNKAAIKAWRDANRFYREGGAISGEIIPGMKDFNTKLVKSLVKNLSDNPEIAVKKIFRPGASKQIKHIQKFTNKNQWKALKTAYLENLIREASDADGVVLGKTFLNRLNKMGDDTLKAIYNGQELASIRSIGAMGEILQSPTGGSGGMLIQLAQAGAVMNLGRMAVGWGAPALGEESVAVILGPPVLSRMLANPKFARWLTIGFTLPRGSKEAAAIGTRIIYHAQKIQKEIIREEAQQKERRYVESMPTVEELRGFGGRGF